MESRSRRARSPLSTPLSPAARRDRTTPRRPGRNGHAAVTAAPIEPFAVPNITVAVEKGASPAEATPAVERGSAAAATPSEVQQACERIVARTRDVQALIGRLERFRYDRVLARVRRVIDEHVPARSTVAVVSRGDEALVTMPGRRGWHFPRTDDGLYAGHHPEDSRAAIAHLEQLRGRGARYLLIPRTAFWWLEHYREFAEHLERAATVVHRDERTCALFALKAGRKTT
jgi:hypothetical protein